MTSNYEAYYKKYLYDRYTDVLTKGFAYLGGKCVVCGSTEQLEFDHKDPSTKSFSITSRVSLSWEKIVIELDKCQLLCNQCHIERHKGIAKCGTIGKFTRCRCLICLTARSKYNKKNKKQRKDRINNGM